jgi:GNAT superfamily N-acetyltransferase
MLSMTARWGEREIQFRVAVPGQADEVLSVLDEAAAWLAGQGISQWPARFELPWVRGAIRCGQTWLVAVDGTISATVTVDWSDPVWGDAGGSAGYLHRMAVRRRAAGLGAVILDWAAGLARRRGRSALRLDCVASNDRLRAYYEAAGFAWRGDVAVAGAPGQRLATGPATVVSRYELLLDTSDGRA